MRTSPVPTGGRDDDIRDYLNFDKIETVGSSTEIPILVLPVGERIEFDIKSADVVHSFWVPQFLFKARRDAVPPAEPIPTAASRYPRSSVKARSSAVARKCATFHSMMNFEVRAEPADL